MRVENLYQTCELFGHIYQRLIQFSMLITVVFISSRSHQIKVLERGTDGLDTIIWIGLGVNNEDNPVLKMLYRRRDSLTTSYKPLIIDYRTRIGPRRVIFSRICPNFHRVNRKRK